MSKERTNNQQMAQWRQAAQVEMTRLSIINENLLSIVIVMLRKFGTLDPDLHGGAPFVHLDKQEVQEVDTQIYGVESKYTEDDPTLTIVLGANGPRIQAEKAAAAANPPMCNCYEGEDCKAEAVTMHTPATDADGVALKHYDGCVYWRHGTVQPIKGPAQPTAMVCRRHKRVGTLGVYCPECNAERATLIMCRNVLAYKRDDGTVVATVEEAKMCAYCKHGDPLEDGKHYLIGDEPKWVGCRNSGYHLLQCGHSKEQHLHGAGMCKASVGSAKDGTLHCCECPEFLCAHNERMPHQDGSITCMNPDCEWMMTQEQVIETAQRGGPQPVQKSIEELEVQSNEGVVQDDSSEQ